MAWKCLGEPEEVDREVEYVYAELWPKHEAYEAKTKLLLKEAFLRCRGKVEGKSQTEGIR